MRPAHDLESECTSKGWPVIQQVRPAHQSKFASDKGNQITTGNVEEEVPLFEQSDDWVLQFYLAYNKGRQRKNWPFLASIATTGKRPDGIIFSHKLKSVLWLDSHLNLGGEAYRVIYQKHEQLQQAI